MPCKNYIDLLRQSLLCAINGDIEQLTFEQLDFETFQKCSKKEKEEIERLLSQLIESLGKEREKIAKEIVKKTSQIAGLQNYKL